MNYVLDQFSHSYNKGYEPLYGILSTPTIENADIDKNKYHAIDTLKLLYVEKLIQAIKHDNVSLVFVISPSYNPLKQETRKQYDEAIKLAQAYSIPFLDCSDLENISGNRELFQDFTHLNDRGATLFTQKLIGNLKQLNIIENE